MSARTRRALLRTGGVALVGALAGCTTTFDGSGPSGESTFPPPEPTSAAPEDPIAMPTGTDWPRFQADAGNTGHVPGVTAVPDEPETYWDFFVQSSPPVVADGSLYTAEHSWERSLVARDAATGRVQWATPVDRGGEFGVPSVAGDTLVVQSYGLLFGFDRATGDLQWERDIGRGPPGSPVVVDGVAYLANGSFSEWPTEAFAVDTATGEVRWRTDLGTGEVHLRGSVAVADHVLVVDGDLVALETSDGTEAWRVSFDAPAETTPTVADGTAYVTDSGGVLHAVETADGTERWTIDVGEPERGTAATADDGEVYVGTDTGLHALTPDGEHRWEFSLSESTTPTVGARAVYVGERGFESRSVFAVDREDGTERWRRRTEQQGISDTIQAGIRGPPTLVDGGVYVVAADGIRAFGRQTG
ncbi:PQQ-binding-like beta-propeller repeat protein [Salinigranum sp. GCM10025319]|uniref:outer membrane protein assembly factor BamB family protein n=1 Tax=Salinigranum sp. GCM10025319 TaxID=3252687 RepID=UPI003622C79C